MLLFNNMLKKIDARNIIVAAILLAIPFLAPSFNFSFNISTILTIISLLFAILIGFFIAAATTDYLRLQTLVSNANSDLIEIFRLGKLIQPTSAQKIADKIDQYMIAILDFPLLNWVPGTKREFDELAKATEEVEPSEGKGLALFNYLQKAKNDLYKINQEMSLAAKEIVSGRHWLILISLATIIAILLLSLRDGNWLFSLLSGIILVVIYQTMYLLKEIDSNLFLAHKLAYQNPQEVFQSIGKLKYYTETAIKNHWANEPEESYRIGIYKNYPKSFEKEIKIVKKN